MDGTRFDAVARTLGRYTSRRASLRALARGMVASTLTHLGVAEVAAACKHPGKKCDTNQDCCTKRCKGSQGNRTCRCAKTNQRCKKRVDCCGSRDCGTNGRCKRLELCSVPGSACFDHDECCSDECGGPDDAGKMVCCVNNGDRCDQTSDCCDEGPNTQSVCQAGRCCRDKGSVCFAPGSEQAATCCFGLVCDIEGAFGHCEVNILP